TMAEAAAALGPLMNLGGTAMSTISQVTAADVNAKALQAQARSIDAQTDFDVRQFRRNASIATGANNAAAAASGVDITRGSPLFDQLDMAKQTEIQAQSIKRSGTIESNNKRFDERMIRKQIPFDIAGGVLQGGSILTRLAGGLPPKVGR